MNVKYRLYHDELMDKKGLIDTENAIELEVFNVEDKEWKDTRTLVSSAPKESWESVELVGPFGNISPKGSYYIKIMEEISPEDDD